MLMKNETVLQTDSIINDLERWKEMYLNRIEFREFSKNTISLYGRVIDEFIEFTRPYDEQASMKDFTSEYFQKFLEHLANRSKKHKGKTISKSTKATYLKALKTFFSFISDNNNELYTYNSFFESIKIKNSSRAEEKMNYFTDDEVERILVVLEADKKAKNKNAYRNALLVKLMLYGGLRISEALNVKVEDFAISENRLFSISIIGKGNKEQYAFVPISDIKEEFDYFKENFKSGLIMRTLRGKQLDRTNAYTIVRNIYKKAGIVRKQGLHILRHTLAMRLTKEGVNPIVIQKVLRHSSLATTTVYAKATTESVAEALCG